jgi:hypothetical protein
VAGHLAGHTNTGDNVTGIGYEATRLNSGNDVVAIGYQAGKGNAKANQFIVKQANINATPLIQGEFSTGNIGIGQIGCIEKLDVAGNIRIVESIYTGLTGDTTLSTILDPSSQKNGIITNYFISDSINFRLGQLFIAKELTMLSVTDVPGTTNGSISGIVITASTTSFGDKVYIQGLISSGSWNIKVGSIVI